MPNKPNLLLMLHKSNDGNLNKQSAVESVSSLADRVLIAEKDMEIEI